MKDEPNKITATLKVVIAGEFYDDEASEETLSYCVEQDLEDAGYDVDVTLLKEQEPIEQEPILLENQHKPYGINTNANSPWISRCPRCGKKVEGKQTRFCKYCGQAVKWE
jgi:hypothetical protein